VNDAEREQKNAEWRTWYADHKPEMQAYYRKRYKRRVRRESLYEREERLARQRDAQARYSATHAEEISEKRKLERAQRCSACYHARQKGERLYVKKSVTGRILGRYCGKCRVKKGL
jgi:hypothetical protein